MKVLCALIAIVATVSPACRRGHGRDAPAVPQVSGTIGLDGLTAPVRVVRDRWGIPHIYAATTHDLFVAEGFVQAQDRLFQMDLWRRAAQGRLSEVLGANFIERDAMTRRVQYHGDMAAEWAAYGADVRDIASAFVFGINAWVDLVASHPPEEFALAGWRPEHWTAADLVNRTDAFLASGNAGDEVLRARLAAAIGPAKADALLAAVFSTPSSVPRGLDLSTISYVIGDALKEVGTPPFFAGLAAPLAIARVKADTVQAGDVGTVRLKADTTYVDDAVGGLRLGPDLTGSNAWAIGADRSAIGTPILAADPHRALANPSLRYLVHLQAPGWNVIGAAAPWLPGVVIGHNDTLAWAMTSRAADVQDLYVEKVNPANPHQVELAGRWVDTKIVREPIAVKGKAQPFAFERESTSHGVIVATDRARHLAFTVRWTGFEPGGAAELAALGIDRAPTAAALQAALDRWKLPAATFVYAVRGGSLGTVNAGWVPIRAGWNGSLPAPGWDGTYEWQRFQPERDPAGEITAERGFVAAANSVPRGRRIEQVLSSGTAIGVDQVKQLQHDTVSWTAQQLVPLLAALHGDRMEVEEARRGLLAWDRRVASASADAAVYVLWERSLLHRLIAGKVEGTLARDVEASAGALLVPALTTPSTLWFSGRVAARRDDMLMAALGDAVDALHARHTDRAPTWGVLHTALFRHPLGITLAARRRFDVGPFERSGYGETVMATGGIDLEQSSGATFSLIADTAVWDRSFATNAPGQSADAGTTHFSDLAKIWAEGGYIPLWFSDAAVAANAEATLMLVPARR